MLKTLLNTLACLLFAMPLLAATPVQFDNPLLRQRADPQAMLHTDGQYYFMATAAEWDRLELRRTRDLNALATAEMKVVWREHGAGPMSAHIWAPEIHFIDGKWYIYFTRSRKDAIWEVRPYVLENASPDPFKGEWKELGRLETGWDSFSLDGTTFKHKGKALLRVDAARAHAGRRPRHEHLHRADGFSEVDHWQGHDADASRVRMGEAQVRRQRRSRGAHPQWQGVHDVLGQRHRRQLLHGAC
jgi:hypothetical protein